MIITISVLWEIMSDFEYFYIMHLIFNIYAFIFRSENMYFLASSSAYLTKSRQGEPRSHRKCTWCRVELPAEGKPPAVFNLERPQ